MILDLFHKEIEFNNIEGYDGFPPELDVRDPIDEACNTGYSYEC